jgi:hypothetical protein
MTLAEDGVWSNVERRWDAIQIEGNKRDKRAVPVSINSLSTIVKAPNFPPHGNLRYFLGRSIASSGGFSHKNE